jgi:hypothetical protein
MSAIVTIPKMTEVKMSKKRKEIQDKLAYFNLLCSMTQAELKQFTAQELRDMGYEKVSTNGKFVFAMGEYPVLIIAHLDTVHYEPVKDFCVSSTGVIMSPQGIGGDDRCGIYMCLEIARRLKCSVLFCEDEETGRKGAHDFVDFAMHKKRNRWRKSIHFMVEFDRMNSNDAVFYQCDNSEFTAFIESTGYFKTTTGTFSDISTIAPKLEIAAVNLSCGYYNQHTKWESVQWHVMQRNIEEGFKLITHADIKPFVYVEKKYSYASGGGWSSGYHDGQRWDSRRGCWVDEDEYFAELRGHAGKPAEQLSMPQAKVDDDSWSKFKEMCTLCKELFLYRDMEYPKEYNYDPHCQECFLKLLRNDTRIKELPPTIDSEGLETCSLCKAQIPWEELEYEQVEGQMGYLPVCAKCAGSDEDTCAECGDFMDLVETHQWYEYGVCSKCLLEHGIHVDEADLVFAEIGEIDEIEDGDEVSSDSCIYCGNPINPKQMYGNRAGWFCQAICRDRYDRLMERRKSG